MPQVGQVQKDAIGKTLTTIEAQIVTMDKLIEKIKDEKYRDSADAPAVKTLKTDTAALRKEHTNLKVGTTDESVYKTLRDKIALKATASAKLLKKIQADEAKSEPDAYQRMIVMTNGHPADLRSFDSTFKGALKSIVQTKGASHHGAVTLVNGTRCLHWAVGDVRIFGTVNKDTGVFTFIGDGRHTGSTNSEYKVDLAVGGSTRASTS